VRLSVLIGAFPSAEPYRAMRRAPIEELFDALQTGDKAALDHHLAPVRVRLCRLAKQRLGESDVDEVVQETLSILWEKRGAVREPGHLLPFLFQILRNKIGAVYLRARRERDRWGDASKLETMAADRLTVHPEALLLAAEHEGIVMKAIQKCAVENDGFGQVLRMLREGSPAVEIQTELGDLPIGAVRTRICRARKRLREILREDFHFDL